MCVKVLNEKDLNEDNYNFIVSNLILVQKDEFTYNDILAKVESIFKGITSELESVIKKCIIRLRESGYLSELGSIYSVVN